MSQLYRSPHQQHRNTRALNFVCEAPLAQTVSIIGDFNNWRPSVNPMVRQPDGGWLVRVELKHGHHRYAFVVDGELVLDPRAMGITRNDQGERVSLIPVS